MWWFLIPLMWGSVAFANDVVQDVHTTCKKSHDFAQKVMELRLNGLTIIQTLEYIQGSKHEVEIVKQAYREDRFYFQGAEEKLVEDFAAKVYIDCVENFESGHGEGRIQQTHQLTTNRHLAKVVM